MMVGSAAFFLLVPGCASPATVEKARGVGIVHGTLGAQLESEVGTPYEGDSHSVRGQVISFEGGAYVMCTLDGTEHRIPLDENMRIDWLVHVGDKIESFLDRGGRAVLIRNIDHDRTHTF